MFYFFQKKRVFEQIEKYKKKPRKRKKMREKPE
jgi:hypothetical protein